MPICHLYKTLLQLFTMSVGHVLLLAQLLCCAAAWEHVIYVDSLEGNNTQECINGSEPCRNLSFAFQPEYRRNSTQYVLLPGTHYLDNSTYDSPFTDLDSLAIVGNGSNSSDTVIGCNTPNSGLAFVGVSNIYLERVTFNHCAALRNSTSRNYTLDGFAMQKSQAALYFYLCNNVSMSMVDITNSPDATGVVMYDTIGTNRIEHCTFSNNRIGRTSPYPGGGGFYVEFSYCAPGDNNCTTDGSDITVNQNANYLFSNCTFVYNKADSIDPTNASTFILPLGRNHIAFGRGGGLSIFFNGNASHNRVSITDCSFDNNRALWGGGLFVEFHDTAGDNLVSVGGITGFVSNKCLSMNKSGTGGGGMRIGHYVYGESVGMNTVTLHGCNFVGNSALNGGGLSISPTLQDTKLDQAAFVNISDCHFSSNIARLGAAVEITRFSLIVKSHILLVQFANCIFQYNTIDYLNETTLPYQKGVGSLYMNDVNVHFRGDVLFESNTGSAVAAVGMPVDFMNCSANFTHNRGNKGGGIALLGAAWILINESSELYFYNNTAETHGGAIYNRYTDKESFASYANCFIRHYNPNLQASQWNATFLFRNNYQMNGIKTNAIFSTSILPCTWVGGSIGSNSSEAFCWQGWDYNCSEEISSEPGSITFNSTDKIKPILKAYPGQPFRLPLIIEDDVHNIITRQTVFSAASNDTHTAEIEPSFTYVSGETVAVTGIENQSFLLELDSDGDRVWHVEFTVELQNCPPGFKATSSNSEAKCECIQNGFLDSVDCDMVSFNASLYNGYWMGTLPGHNNTLFVSLCLPNFCYLSPNQSSFPLPNSAKALDGLICGSQNRTGILCGECKDGYGPVVNTETHECILCNDTNIAANATYYVLSVYLPLFILFAAIILFNIKLTTGPANAFIVYSQVVASRFDLSADGQITFNAITNDSRALQMAYKVPYGIFNLEFIENIISRLCLGTTLITPDVISLDYIVAVFPLLMIVIVVLFMKLSSCIINRIRRTTLCHRSGAFSHLCGNWRLGEGLLHAFAAFLLLSYNKFTLVSAYLVQLVGAQSFYDENSAEIIQDISFTGNYTSAHPMNVLKYHLVGYIVFATFVVIPPLLLLEYPVKLLEWCVNKVKCLQRFYPADKVHILLDTFQGCYRNKMRFFAGLYFLFRLIISVSYIITDNTLQQFILQQIFCTIFIMLVALCQPYTEDKKIFNYIDTLIFTNLALLNALSLYLYIFSQAYSGKSIPVSVFVIQYVLLFLPLLYMMAYILCYFSRPCCSTGMWLRCTQCFRNRKYQPLDEVIRDDVSTTDATQDRDEIEALFERAEADNTYRPNPGPVSEPFTNVCIHDTGQGMKGGSSSDSGVRSHHSSINNYGSTASRTVSIHTPLFSSGQATGSSDQNTDT